MCERVRVLCVCCACSVCQWCASIMDTHALTNLHVHVHIHLHSSSLRKARRVSFCSERLASRSACCLEPEEEESPACDTAASSLRRRWTSSIRRKSCRSPEETTIRKKSPKSQRARPMSNFTSLTLLNNVKWLDTKTPQRAIIWATEHVLIHQSAAERLTCRISAWKVSISRKRRKTRRASKRLVSSSCNGSILRWVAARSSLKPKKKSLNTLSLPSTDLYVCVGVRACARTHARTRIRAL